MRTGLIRYNVKDRDRKHRGVDRDFDIDLLVKVINSDAVQEQVKNRDLYGYYGHWPRVKFGLSPIEGSIVGGKVVNLEPAFVTVYLKAYPDGTIEHEQEFILEHGPGRIAARLFAAKRGGFSSAIDAPLERGLLRPRGMYGFDYVLEPNYNTNRGYTLDSAESNSLVLDDVGEYMQQIDGFNSVLDSMQADFDLQQQTVAHLAQQNDELIDMILKINGGVMPVLDGVIQMPQLVSKRNHLSSADDFLSEEIPSYQMPEDDKPAPAKSSFSQSVNSYLSGRRF